MEPTNINSNFSGVKTSTPPLGSINPRPVHNPWLITLLVVIILGAIGYSAWTYFDGEQNDSYETNSYQPPKHTNTGTQTAFANDGIDSALTSAGTIDNSADMNTINSQYK